MLAYAGIEAASDLAPDIDVEPRDLKRIVSLGAFAVPLVYAGMAAIALMAVPVVAGPHGPETALGNEFVEAPVLGVVSAYHPVWVSRRDALARRAGRHPGALLGDDDGPAGRLPAHLHAGDQPPDPELAGQAEQPPRDPARGDRDLRRDRDRPRRADRRQAAGRHLRLRRDPGDHDRPALDRAPAGHRAGAPAAVPGAVRRPLARRPPAGPGDLRRPRQRPRLRQRARLPRPRPLGRRRLDAVRPALLRRLPQGLRGNDADQAGLGDREGADQAGAGSRLPQHPRARLRHQARRRHRRHRRAARRGRAGGVRRGRGRDPARTSST